MRGVRNKKDRSQLLKKHIQKQIHGINKCYKKVVGSGQLTQCWDG